MIGLIQKVLLDMVEGEGGPELVTVVREAAGVPPERVFRIGVPYDDAECRRLMAAASEHLGLYGEPLFDRYAEYFFRDAQARFPQWFAMCPSARDLLERQPVIHNCFAAGLQSHSQRRSVNDKFRTLPVAADNELHIEYRSPNHLSALYAALARWVLRHYGERAHVVIEPHADSSPAEERATIRVAWMHPVPVSSNGCPLHANASEDQA